MLVTVSELISRAATAADMTDNFIKPSEWLSWANVKDKELAVRVAQLGVPYRQYDEMITVDGSLEYTIAEPLAIIAVYYVEADGKFKRLKVKSPIQLVTLSDANKGVPSHCHIRRYGSSIFIQPYPTPTDSALVVRAIEHPGKLVLSNPGLGEYDSVNYPLNWEEYIVLGMAKNALAKEETVNPLIDAQLREIISHIEASASNYLMTDLATIRDINSDDWDSAWYWPC